MKKLKLLEISTTEAKGETCADKAEWIVSKAVAENAAAVRITDTVGNAMVLSDFAAQKLEAAGVEACRGATYGATIRWTDRNGKQSCGVDGCGTIREAWEKAEGFARRCGWTPPKWWQWWRWPDTRIPSENAKLNG